MSFLTTRSVDITLPNVIVVGLMVIAFWWIVKTVQRTAPNPVTGALASMQ